MTSKVFLESVQICPNDTQVHVAHEILTVVEQDLIFQWTYQLLAMQFLQEIKFCAQYSAYSMVLIYCIVQYKIANFI